MKEIKMLTVVLPHTSQKVATLFSMYPCGLYARKSSYTHLLTMTYDLWSNVLEPSSTPDAYNPLSPFSLISAVMFCCFNFKDSMLLSRNWRNNNETANSRTMGERFEDLNVFCFLCVFGGISICHSELETFGIQRILSIFHSQCQEAGGAYQTN